MKQELRIIKASAMAGVTDLIFGAIAFWTKFGDWYYSHFHNFGIFGFSLIAYAYWHYSFYLADINKELEDVTNDGSGRKNDTGTRRY